MSPRPRAVARLAAAMILALALAGCSSDGEDGPAPEAEQSSSAASENADPGVVTEDDGKSVTTYRGIPPEFPTDEVPLLSEDDVVSGSESTERGRTSSSVIISSDLPPLDALTQATQLLDETDLELLGPAPTTEDEPAVYTGENGLFLIVLATPVEEGSELTYNVETR